VRRCAAPAWPRRYFSAPPPPPRGAAPGQGYFQFMVCNGLTNQRQAILEAALLARHFGLGLVLPRLVSNGMQDLTKGTAPVIVLDAKEHGGLPFGDVFVRHPYTRELTLSNSSGILPARFVVDAQDAHSAALARLECEPAAGIVPAGGAVTLRVTLTALRLAPLALPLLVTLLGDGDGEPLKIMCHARGRGPRVRVAPAVAVCVVAVRVVRTARAAVRIVRAAAVRGRAAVRIVRAAAVRAACVACVRAVVVAVARVVAVRVAAAAVDVEARLTAEELESDAAQHRVKVVVEEPRGLA
jgi:hypothetical protein